MDKLVETLKAIDASSLPNMGQEDIILTNEYHPLVVTAQAEATDFLITKEGSPCFENMDLLYKTHGYLVLPGERDRFGWLTGLIETKKGIIVFG